MAMVVGIIMLSFFVSSWIIIHFGRNPDSGGRPPSDSIVVRIAVVSRGVLFHVWDRDSVVVVEFSMNITNVAVVIRM